MAFFPVEIHTPMHYRLCLVLTSLLSLITSLGSPAAADPLVFTGFDVSFSKPGGADHLDPANQDMITSDVVIARGGTAGIYNIAVESFYTSNSSPAGTMWAFPSNNPEASISATNYASLTFEDWETALGSAGNLLFNITAGPGVLHLVDSDIYLDIHFTHWGTAGGGAGFAYDRAALTSSTSADFNDDGIVDGKDFLIWQRNFGTGTMLSEGDANGDEAVDALDLVEWQTAYGGSLSPNLAVVPEPASGLLSLFALVSCSGFSRFFRGRARHTPICDDFT